MFNFEATIVGNKIKHTATALVDSGANISTISPNLILDEPYHSTETMIETINGPAKAIGFIDHLEINVHGRVCILPMYIVEQKYDLILGKNWMDTMDAGVQMINGKRCLRFKSEIVFASEDIDNQEESIPEVFLAEIEELDDNTLEWTFPGIETVKPIDIVVFPSPYLVGDMAETKISFPFGFSCCKCNGNLALYLP